MSDLEKKPKKWTKNGDDKVLVQEKGAAPSPVEDPVESARLIVQKKTGSKEKLKMIFGKLTSDSSVDTNKRWRQLQQKRCWISCGSLRKVLLE